MTQNYLKECLKQFPQVTKQLFGKEAKLEEIEKDAQQLHGTKTVQEVLDRLCKWAEYEPWIKKYYMIPLGENLTDAHKTISWNFLKEKDERERFKVC